MGGQFLASPIVAIATTPSGEGYWLAAADGGVFSFGDAPYRGSLPALGLQVDAVDLAPSPSGVGYLVASSDGGVFAFGDATFAGSGFSSGMAPVVGIATTIDGDGYWLARRDGDVSGFGSPPSFESAAVETDGPVVGIARAPSGGAWLASSGIPPLPGGGTEIFDNRRPVTYYGAAVSTLMGVLGETDPDTAAARLIAQAQQWVTADHGVLPTFELITTIATSFPTSSGNYTAFTDAADVQRYLDAARRHDVYLLMDLQPGRSDFLTQAMAYEQFLLQPDVGLALDPEWRMGPTQVPAKVIGSVSAEEVNCVTAWLSDLVVNNGLPEKLLVIHQFTHQMVPDRHLIVARPGLAITFHADGFGTVPQKLAKYEQLHGVAPFYSGLKLFFDEDQRVMTPAEVLALVPPPDLISYQ